MKRCPECRRDYYDDSLLYCLDDGTALLDGPASLPNGDEPQTAILQDFADSDGPRTAVLPQAPATGPVSISRSGPKAMWFAAAGAVVALVLGSYLAYRSYRGGRSGEIRTVAVLPFENKSSDPDTDYLSEGLGESIIFRLSQLPGLKVSPLSSVLRYKDSDVAKAAAELGVDSVVTGRMAKRGDDLSITVELVDVRNNASIWGERYERKMSDLLSIQREITTTITQKLQLKLAGNEKGIAKKYTDSNEAYQLYLNGRFHFARRTKDDIYKSIDLYQQAVAIDPKFALAYSALAESWSVIPSYPYASPAECIPNAKAASAKALELDPDLPEAHTVAGMIAATYDWDWTSAEREFKRSLEIDPNLAATHYRYAWTYLSPLGRHDEAIAEMRKAMELEPLSLIQGANFAGVLMYARHYDEAIAQAQKTLDLDPRFFGAQSWLCHSLIARGRYADALAIAEPTLQSENPFLSDLGLAYAGSGQREKALGILDRWNEAEKKRYTMNYLVAILNGQLGDKDAAFAQLEKAYANHDWFLQRLKVDPMADPLLSDPRYDALIKRLNFPQ
jgi:TolB-like protein/Tfp pilus assembly protein PilF